MGEYVASQLVKKMIKTKIQIDYADVLVMGFAFKENCPDLRNTKVIDIISSLKDYNINADVYDPWISPDEAVREYGVNIHNNIPEKKYDAILFAVAHDEFKKMTMGEILSLTKSNYFIYDLKYIIDSDLVIERL
ncbi:Vi polysaccharide biosynthesis protein, UDP-glucose/GDP-mannose dehydrogenase [Salmonella enterica subsp. arizonae]|nr:Vi polysaccharide biosynthesis protein, UDP-glucose/GDP-mannose dehydrogenase [Salmonella enterica subsp. arizonae]